MLRTLTLTIVTLLLKGTIMANETIDRKGEQQLVAQVPVGVIFEHYKGQKYKIIEIGRHSETLQLQVVYQSLYDSAEFGDHAIWIRPLEMFLEMVVIDGQEIPRFHMISECDG
jgi:hypothetical protein